MPLISDSIGLTTSHQKGGNAFLQCVISRVAEMESSGSRKEVGLGREDCLAVLWAEIQNRSSGIYKPRTNSPLKGIEPRSI
jgi:hypothetical protein